MNPDDPYADIVGHVAATATVAPYVDITGASTVAVAPDTAMDDGVGGKVYNKNVEPWKSAAIALGFHTPTAPPFIPHLPPSIAAPRDVTINTPDKRASTPPLPVRAAMLLGQMAQPFLVRGDESPIVALGRGSLETAAGIARAIGGSAFDAAITPGVGEERRQNLRAPTPSMPFAPGVYDAEHGAVTGQQRALAVAQTLANIAAGPIAGKVEGLLGPKIVAGLEAPGLVSETATKVLGGVAAGAPIGASYTPGDPAAGALAMSLFGGALEPLHPIEKPTAPTSLLGDALPAPPPTLDAEPAVAPLDATPNTAAEVSASDVDAEAAAYARDIAQGTGARTASPNVATVPTASLTVDPERFQFKRGLDQQTGAGAELKGVSTYNPDLAGVLSVWHDPVDGKDYVVNGHHRFDLAQRTNTPTVDVRYLDAPNAQAARAKGALINIAEGRGTALDAGKYFRDAGATPETLSDAGVSLRGAVANRGLSLSRLAPDVFDRVARGDVSEETGAAVGKVLDAPEQQRAAIQLVEKSGRRLSSAEVENVARQVRDAGSTTTSQESLFGKEEITLSLAVERARLAESFKKDIAGDARLFGFVSKAGRADELARGGNVIDAAESGRLATESAQHSEVFDRLATRSGPVGDILTEGARRLANGERIASVKADIEPRLRAAVSEDVAAGAQARLGRSEGDVSEQGTAPSVAGRPGNSADAEEANGRVADSQDNAQSGMFGAFAADPYHDLTGALRVHEARDLFGEETPDDTPAQTGLFGSREGTSASRSLRETEAAARAEIPRLREILNRTTDFKMRTATATRLAELERLVNRAEKITPDELRARSQAGEGEIFGAYADLAKTPDNGRGHVSAEVPPEASPTEVAPAVNKYVDAFRRVFDVSSRSPEAESTGLLVREHNAQRAINDERALESLRSFAGSFKGMPESDRLAFIDRIETGADQPTPDLTKAAGTIRDLLDNARDDIIALGTGKLGSFYEHYFPHLWADEAEAEKVIGGILSKRSLTGSGDFLERRSIVTMKDGIEAGLTPLTTNPVDATMLKLREMHRYLMGQRIMEEMKSRGLAKFVSAFEDAPTGYTRIEDKIARVYGPPTIKVTEAFDKLAREKIEGIMSSLGMEHSREARIGGTRLGYYQMGSDKVVTKAATPLDVVYHEFGHALDDRYGLWDFLLDPKNKGPEAIADRKVLQNELRALADSRFEGQDPGPGYRGYVRNKYEKMAVTVQAFLHAPELMRGVAPNVMSKFRAFIESHPELRGLNEVKPSLVHATETHEVPVGGMVVKGDYYAPEPVTSVLNNFLAPGLRGNPFYDAFRGVGNSLNQVQLGLSAFHLGFTSMDATVSKAALGVEQLLSGEPVKALGSFARANILTAPFETYIRGSKVLRESLTPGTQGADMAAIVDGLIKGGGRVRTDAFYKNTAVENFGKALQAGRDAVRQPFSLRSGATLASVPFRAAYNGLGAIIQAASYPILEHIVPRQKLGVFADLAKSELAKLPPGATPDVVREAMSKAWDSVENRMGQMTYDNLMWSRVTKDIAMISTRSVGWNLGTIRELGGGVIDLAKAADNTRLSERIGAVAESHRAAYAIALPAVVALHGAVLQYLMTGKAPESTKDYFFPRTGHLNPDGTEERVQLPSYMRDVYAYGEHPYETIKHKLHPLVSVIADMLENKDFRNNEIRNPDDPLVVQLGQEARYIAAQFKPMGVSNMQAARDRGEPVAEQAGAFVGVTPAPRDRTRTPAQLKMSELLQQSAPGGRTPEEVDASNAHRALVAGLRGGTPDARANVLAAVQGGEITPQTAIKTLKSGLTSTSEIESFKRLTATQAIEVWKVASPEEQARWRGAMLNKIVSAVKRGQQIAIPKGLVSDTTAPQTSLLSPPQKVSGGLLGSAIKSARSAGGLLGSALSGNRPGDVR